MKITKQYLKQIIKEEYKILLEQQQELALDNPAAAPKIQSTEEKRKEEEKRKQNQEKKRQLTAQLEMAKRQLTLFDLETTLKQRQSNQRPTEKESLKARINSLQDEINNMG